ncbi:hypothetical protein D9615_006826 [Tricholomella constricta]|uniref:Nephrocystin 3-like N-terminal domain-containing protein n=1 Tax=Tricholomella constricta TaxID=117010 RepID=A0A8H5H6K4_9AGAR|nr:hypothetical protein D9615_006826 [Tricholomella constricta]
MFEISSNNVINGGEFIDAQNYYAISGDFSVEEVDAAITALRDASIRGATHDSADRPSPPRCQPGTRKAILKRIDKWVNAMEIRMFSTGRRVGGQVMWLHGPAGAGKSAIAQTVSEKYASSNQLAGSFFFSRRTAGHDNAKPFFPTIALQLATSISRMRRLIASAVKKDPLIFDKSLATHSQPGPPPSAPPFLVVLDGLNECNDKNSQRAILDCIADILHSHQIPLCIVVASRPEPHIKDAFSSGHFSSRNILEELSLYLKDTLEISNAKCDIRAFLDAEFTKIHDSGKHRHCMKSVHKPWPHSDVIDILVDLSGGYFIYVATVIRFVDEDFFSPNSTDYLLVRILGAIFIDLPSLEYANEPICDPVAIERIFGLEQGAVHFTLGGMHSLLRVDRGGRFFIDSAEHHADIALNILRRGHKLIPFRIYSGWSFHASKASSSSQILAQLAGFDNNYWEHIFDEILNVSRSHRRIKQFCFLTVAYTLGTAIKWLELVDESRVNQMLGLLNRVFRGLVTLEHDDKVIIQGELYLFDESMQQSSSLAKIRAVEEASGYQHFETFVKNPVYSEGLFASPDACHALLASCCIDLTICIKHNLKMNPHDWQRRIPWDPRGLYLSVDFDDVQSPWRNYFTESKGFPLFHDEHYVTHIGATYAPCHWEKHLRYASPGDESILLRLRRVGHLLLERSPACPWVEPLPDPDLEKAKEVLEWLKKMPNPPKDLIRQWTTCSSCGNLHEDFDDSDPELDYGLRNRSLEPSSPSPKLEANPGRPSTQGTDQAVPVTTSTTTAASSNLNSQGQSASPVDEGVPGCMGSQWTPCGELHEDSEDPSGSQEWMYHHQSTASEIDKIDSETAESHSSSSTTTPDPRTSGENDEAEPAETHSTSIPQPETIPSTQGTDRPAVVPSSTTKAPDASNSPGQRVAPVDEGVPGCMGWLCRKLRLLSRQKNRSKQRT